MAAVELEPAAGQIKRQDDARATRNKSGDRRRDDPSYQPNQLAALRPAAERAGRDHGGEQRLRAGGDFAQVLVDAIARWSHFDELLAQALLANVRARDGRAILSDVLEGLLQHAIVIHRYVLCQPAAGVRSALRRAKWKRSRRRGATANFWP